jgi:hypothetical protein
VLHYITTVLHYIGLERLARDKNFSFLGPFINCEEKEYLSIQPLITFSIRHPCVNSRKKFVRNS